MYGQSGGAISVSQEPQSQPVAHSVVTTFDYNIERTAKNLNIIEDKLHAILNLRGPEKSDKASSVPMEDDLTKAINNRLNTYALLNDRLDRIVAHLEKIV